MMGRTYAIGYEPDLDETLMARPTRTVLNPRLAVGGLVSACVAAAGSRSCPNRSSASFSRSTAPSAWRTAPATIAHDIRLACHGLDKHDNDFVVGLVGKELFPLSHVVQSDAQDAADVVVPRTPRSRSSWTRRVAERMAGVAGRNPKALAFNGRRARSSASSDRPGARAASPRLGSPRSCISSSSGRVAELVARMASTRRTSSARTTSATSVRTPRAS